MHVTFTYKQLWANRHKDSHATCFIIFTGPSYLFFYYSNNIFHEKCTRRISTIPQRKFYEQSGGYQTERTGWVSSQTQNRFWVNVQVPFWEEKCTEVLGSWCPLTARAVGVVCRILVVVTPHRPNASMSTTPNQEKNKTKQILLISTA